MLATTSTAAMAQDASEIIVTGQGNAVVTLGDSEVTIREFPQSVTVVSREQIDLTQANDLDDVLLQTPGLTLFGANEATYFARGFQIGTLQFDGVPIDVYSAAMTAPDTALYDRVEVLRGAAGLWQGAGSFGGAINLVRKRANPAGISGRASVDTEGAFRFEADASTALDTDGRVRVRGVGVYDRTNSFIDFVKGDKVLVYGAFDADVTDSTSLSAAISYQDADDVPFPDALPRYANGDALPVARDTFLGASWNQRSVKTTQIFGEIAQDLGSDWKARIAATHLDSDRDSLTLQASGAVNPVTDLTGGRMAANLLSTKQTSIDASVAGSFNLFGREHELQFGANWRDLSNGLLNGSQVLVGGIDVLDFDPTSVAEPTIAADQGQETTDSDQFGMFAATRLSPADGLKLILGGRLSWFDTVYDFVYLPFPGLIDDHQEYSASGVFTPYAGLTYDLSSGVTFYASYAEAFEPQDERQRDGSFIAPLTGENYEAGIKGSFLGDRLLASATLYRVKQVNRAQQDPDYSCFQAEIDNQPGRCFIAEGAVRTQGVELEISGRPVPQWLITGGYTYADTEYLRDRDGAGDPTANEGQPFASFTPKHMLRLWTNYRFGERFSAGGSVSYQSKWTQSNTATYSQEGYVLADLYVGYDVVPGVTASVNVNNLFDKTYFTSISSTAFGNRYGAPRSATFTLRGRF